MTVERPYDIWVEFNDIAPDGTVVTYSDFAMPGADLAVGATLTAGDAEGCRCPATVVDVGSTSGHIAADLSLVGARKITLRLDLSKFQASGEAGWANG